MLNLILYFERFDERYSQYRFADRESLYFTHL